MKVPVSVALAADLRDVVDEVAVTLDRPRSWVVERALRAWLADRFDIVPVAAAPAEAVPEGAAQ